MTKLLPFLTIFALSAAMAAQTKIPVGTIIPVQLDTTINAKKWKPGKAVTAEVAQDVPLYNGSTIKAFTRVHGEVVSITPPSKTQPATIALRFNRIDTSGNPTPIVTNLRALASNLQVQSAEQQIPLVSDPHAPPPWTQNTILVGGDDPYGADAEYREAGTIERGRQVVGKAVFAGRWGSLSHIAPCPGDESSEADDKPQALWVFSHDACGVYGYNAVITNAGRSNPAGAIDLASTKGNLTLYSGSALLLRVVSADSRLSAE